MKNSYTQNVRWEPAVIISFWTSRPVTEFCRIVLAHPVGMTIDNQQRRTDGGWTCDNDVGHFSLIPELEPRSAWMSQNCQRMPANLRAYVCVSQETSREVISWLWGWSQWCREKLSGIGMSKRYSLMDLGQDSFVLCFYCHQSLCSRFMCITETSKTYLVSSHSDRTPFWPRPSIVQYAGIFGQVIE